MENTNKVQNNNIKKIVMILIEKIYFKDVKNVKYNNNSTLHIVANKESIKQDMASYHEYYLKYKKAV